MKFIYTIKEYIKIAFKCLKYVYQTNKKGTVFQLIVLILSPLTFNIITVINARLADSMQKNFGTGITQYILPIFAFLVIFTIVGSFFDFLNTKIGFRWRVMLNREVFTDQLSKKKDFTIPFTDSSDYENLSQRINNGTGQGKYAQVYIAKNIPDFIALIINILFTGYIAYAYNWMFATLIIISSLPGFYLLFTQSFAQRKNFESNLDRIKYINVYSGMFMSYQTLKDAKSSNNAKKFIDTFHKGNTEFLDTQIKIQDHYANIGFVAGLLTTFVIFLIQFYVIKDVISGAVLIGQATLIIVQVSRLNSSIKSLSAFLPDQYENVVTSKYLFLQQETEENVDRIKGKDFAVQNDLIKFKDVSFVYKDIEFKEMNKLTEEIDSIATRYFGLKKPEIVPKEKEASDFNLHIENLTIHRGEKIAIVGKNGNGKTTFIQLLLNLYQPQSGDITIYGNNLKDLSQDTITENFSVLFQDYGQSPLKVNEYIALSEKNEIDMDSVQAAAKISTADEFIEKWDNQYTQQLGVYMKGVKPSKGQWQKLALARTFYKDSPIVILDEPTASIDASSSKKIFENISKIDKDKTLILISHNMTDIAKFVDRIIVFDKGRIVGDGHHADLLKTCEVYRNLYESENR